MLNLTAEEQKQGKLAEIDITLSLALYLCKNPNKVEKQIFTPFGSSITFFGRNSVLKYPCFMFC